MNKSKNYRRINLIVQTAEMFERILKGRLRRKLEGEIEEEQYGFGKDRSTVDLNFIWRNIMDKRWEYGKGCVDDRDTLTKKQINIAEMQMIKAMYKNRDSSVKTRIGDTK